jgi:hypothetical protein
LARGAAVLAVSVENAHILTAWDMDTVVQVVVGAASLAGPWEVVDFRDVAAEGVEPGGVAPDEEEEAVPVVGGLVAPQASL